MNLNSSIAHLPTLLLLATGMETMAIAEPTQIDSQSWKITLPLPGADGQTAEITNPQFAAYLEDPASIPEEMTRFFRKEKGAFLFHCRAGGATTPNTDFPRSEFREMRGNSPEDEYEWTLEEGGTLEMRFRIGPLEGGAEKLIFAQIHGHEPESKPLIKCLWEKGYLRLLIKSGEGLEDYKAKQRYLALAEGQWYTCRIEAGTQALRVSIDDVVVETFGRDHLGFWPEGNTFYFKEGNYFQESEEGRAATVSISHLSLSHGPPKAEASPPSNP